VQRIGDGVELIDTRLAGWEGVTAAFLIRAERPALVETGARTSAASVREALTEAGIGPDDLAWIVLTHVHLDHCGGVGLLAEAFPRATVVVHRRGARHLVDPERLVAASFAVYGETSPLYGGLDPVPEERIVAADDGHVVDLGGGRRLAMLETLGHARHHMSVLDQAEGVVLAGDALGISFTGTDLYQALPPPDVDIDLGVASLRRLAGLRPAALAPSHFGPVADPEAALAEAERQQRVMAPVALEAWRREPTVGSVAAALSAVLPLEQAVPDAGARERWRRLGWVDNTAAGLAAWAEARAEVEAAG
jgi:glyoxylase-like metal-dependent hydrolase (beta-lactamase superfamily II)